MHCHHSGPNMCATRCIWWSPNLRYTTKALTYRCAEQTRNVGVGSMAKLHSVLYPLYVLSSPIWTQSQNHTDMGHPIQNNSSWGCIFTLPTKESKFMIFYNQLYLDEKITFSTTVARNGWGVNVWKTLELTKEKWQTITNQPPPPLCPNNL